MKVGNPQFLQIRQFLLYSLKCPRETIYIAHRANHLFTLKPMGVLLTARVEVAQFGGAFHIKLCRRRENLLQVIEKIIAVGIEWHETLQNSRHQLGETLPKNRL